MLEINKEVKNMDYRKALPHVGHNIVISNYSNENIAVECEDCHEVIVDADISKGKEYGKNSI